MFPGVASQAIDWPGMKGLTEDVLRYGGWLCAAANARLGWMYPKARISGIDTTVIAWIWPRTLVCPNPVCRGTMPLVGSFWLARKPGKERYIEAVPEGDHVRFVIRGPAGSLVKVPSPEAARNASYAVHQSR